MYLANDNITNLIGEDVLRELSTLTPDIWSNTSKKILEREIANNIHIIRLSHVIYEASSSEFPRGRNKQSDILRNR